MKLRVERVEKLIRTYALIVWLMILVNFFFGHLLRVDVGQLASNVVSWLHSVEIPILKWLCFLEIYEWRYLT